jgi:hypothetical protein
MSALVSHAARQADRLSACIVDARLALAPGGLVFALRLAHIGPVWLTRRFWSLIDGAYFYRSYPEELVPDRCNSAAATIEALVLWHTAWLHGALDGLFFWIGDARRESALPINWSSDVITRYERLSEAFPMVSSGETTAPPIEPLTACGQEAFALAAALTTDAPIILTASHQQGQPPLICTEAAAIAHIDVHGPTEWTPNASWADRIVPARIKPLVDQLEYLGTRITAVHTLAPAAMSLPSSLPGDDTGEVDRCDHNSDRWPWRSAHAFWHQLS